MLPILADAADHGLLMVDMSRASETFVNGLNDAGEIFGRYIDQSSNSQAFIWRQFGFISFGTAGSVSMLPTAINPKAR
jgi:hypothetical protein